MKSESNRRFSIARMTVLARTLVRARVARFLADQPTFCQMDSVRVGQNVVGWRSVEWEGENQAQVGSFFHGDITVGRRTRFGTYSYVTGDVAVGRYGSFGSQVALISHDRHPIETPALYVSSPFPRPSRTGDEGWRSAGRLRIGHDVWIGNGAAVLGAVTVGNGAVIGANSVVTADVDPFSIVAGTPARAVRARFDDEIVQLLQRWAWWDRTDDELLIYGELLDMDLTADRARATELLRAVIVNDG